MKYIIPFFIVLFLLCALFSSFPNTLVNEQITTPPLQLRQKAINEASIDHILVKYLKDNPKYHYLIYDSRTIRWLLEGLMNVKLIEDPAQRKLGTECNACMELHLKTPRVLVVPFMLQNSSKKYDYFSGAFSPDDKFYAVLDVCYTTVGTFAYELNEPGPIDDRKSQIADINIVTLFDIMKCPSLVVEVLEEKIQRFDKKSLQEKPIEDSSGFNRINFIMEQYDLMIKNLSLMGRYEDALHWCEQYMDLFSEYEGVHPHGVPYKMLIKKSCLRKMADIYEKKGDLNSAEKCYRQALSMVEEFLNTAKEDQKRNLWKNEITIIKNKINKLQK